MTNKTHKVQKMDFVFNCPICNEKLFLIGCRNTECTFGYFNYDAQEQEEESFLSQIV